MYLTEAHEPTMNYGHVLSLPVYLIHIVQTVAADSRPTSKSHRPISSKSWMWWECDKFLSSYLVQFHHSFLYPFSRGLKIGRNSLAGLSVLLHFVPLLPSWPKRDLTGCPVNQSALLVDQRLEHPWPRDRKNAAPTNWHERPYVRPLPSRMGQHRNTRGQNMFPLLLTSSHPVHHSLPELNPNNISHPPCSSL